MDEVVRYTYRLRPGAIAQAALLAEWGRCRWLWNEAVHQWRSGRRPTRSALKKMLTEARARCGWLRDGSVVAQQETLSEYTQALKQSFRLKGRGRPRPKKRHVARPSLPYTRRGFSILDGRLCLAKGAVIPVVWSRDLPTTPSSCCVFRDALGHWYVSFVVRRQIRLAAEADGTIGVDWGVSTTATATDERFDLPHLGYRKRCAAELAKVQRKMSRRHRPSGHPQSRGYEAAKRQAARLQKKAAQQNAHAARVWAKGVVDNHAVIAVEDFKPTFLAKTTMARKAADAAIGAAKRELVDRGTRAGRKVVLVPPAYTTMTCSECGSRAKTRLGLGVRVFRCERCGHTACRDRNAARTILATAERIRAGVDDVRHAITSFRESWSGAV